MAGKEPGAVVVTGASTGIGRATALHLAEWGFQVFAGVRRKKDAESLAAEASGELTPITLDVTKERSIAAARAKVQRAVGGRGLAGLVNNAGIAIGGPVEKMPIADFQKVLDVNLTGAVHTTQAFLPLIRKGGGRIIFMASIGGRVASPFFGAYNASKFGLEGVADALRRELAPWKLEVVVIEPGSISTPIWEKGRANTDSSQAAAAPGTGTRRGEAAKADRVYEEAGERMREITREADERGLHPDRVARVVRKALTARRPKTRYLVGTDAKIMYRAQRLLGDRRFDRLMRRRLKLPDQA